MTQASRKGSLPVPAALRAPPLARSLRWHSALLPRLHRGLCTLRQVGPGSEGDSAPLCGVGASVGLLGAGQRCRWGSGLDNVSGKEGVGSPHGTFN